MVLIGHGSERRDLGDQTDRGDHTLMRVGDVGRVMIESRHRADTADHYGHRMGITAEARKELRHLFVNHRVARHTIVEVSLLGCRWQFAVQKQVAGFQKIAVFGKLIDRVTAIEQGAFVTVDVGDFGFARCRGGEARIVGEHLGILVEWTNINDVWSDSALSYRQVECFAF